MDQNLNARPKTRKLLEKNIGPKLPNTGFSSDFLDRTPKAQATTTKNRQIRLH